jgi:glucose/arabinose dehydrogenase
MNLWLNTIGLPHLVLVGITVGSLSGCGGSSSNRAATPAQGETAGAARTTNSCEGDAGITLPAGFCASIFADNLGHARHLAVAPNGDVYVNTWSSMYTTMKNAPGGFIVALRDADHDGRAETVERFGTVYQDGKPGGGTGIAVHDGALYAEVDNNIVRYALGADAAPRSQPEVIVTGLPQGGDHPMHPFAIGTDGMIYIDSGSPSNACQEKNRAFESPGRRPCRELETRAGIWRYDTKKTGQTFSPRERYATGLRNPEALAVQPRDGALFAVVHGRDQLSENWPKLYTVAQQNELPAEILVRVSDGADFGWPSCYFDAMQAKQVLAPEYRGDGGKAVGDCAMKGRPDLAFPAHWAPDALAFYPGTAFPAKYQGGAFVSFHGSWNRNPKQAGYLVAFVPFADGKPNGTYEEFATGFAGKELPADPMQAAHRPMGLAVSPDGAVYVSDDVNGRVWRISYRGN